MRTSLLALTLLACRSETKPVIDGPLDSGLLVVDSDGDGYLSNEDCDDNNSTVNEGAIEVCDGVDNNCDGTIDEGVSTTYYNDNDGDGFGDILFSVEACEPPEGFVPFANDCDDEDATTYPGATEQCDEIDNDCDELIDEDLELNWYADADGDGYGDPESYIEDCNPGTGYVANDEDCNDEEPAAYNDAEEICDGIDNDCDGTVDNGFEGNWYFDADGDGFGNAFTTYIGCSPPSGFVENDLDCDDLDHSINPDGVEQCNDYIDNDCDGSIDEPDAIDAQVWYADGDSDGFGDVNQSQLACYQPNGYVTNDNDCDDGEVTVFPGGIEVCDGLDNDCSGTADDSATDSLTWYSDGDSDGFGDLNDMMSSCSQPSGYVSDNTDCNPSDGAIYPGADEYCNGYDDDCDNIIDEDTAVDSQLWFADADSDGYGDSSNGLQSCSQPSGYITDNTDCNDSEALAYPGADEYCNGIDDNCDGTIDETTAIDSQLWFSDGDSDGYGDSSNSIQSCSQPGGYVLDSTDCNPSDGAIYPGADEYCNGYDDDCDNIIDEDTAVDSQLWFADADSDGYGDSSNGLQSCSQPSGYITDNTDCNDSNSDISPSAIEECNLIDDDCNGNIDDNAIDALIWYPDNDGDGFGDSNSPLLSCTQPTGYIADGNDCNNSNFNINPNAPEVCNGLDNDCNGLIDDGTECYDDDGDGFSEDQGDCDDSNPNIYPNAPELPDGIDNDCDGLIDEGTTSYDDDGDGFSEDQGDCDDSNPNIYPNAPELLDGVDNDCDGLIDEGTTSYDDDGDGFSELDGDCDDSNPNISPNSPELWDCSDHDCDGYSLPLGDGRDGQLTATGNHIFSTVTQSVSGTLTAGSTSATLSSTSGFSSGDYVLIIDMHGGSAGNYDVIEIDNVIGSGLNLTSPLQYDYPSSDTVVAVRVPQYSGVTLGGTLSPPAWNGSEGGIMAFMVSGTANLSGTVHVNERGHRGGARTYIATQVGEQGEGYSGNQSRASSANFSGGGGGSSPSLTHASGGGGGYATSGDAGYTSGGWGNTPGAGGGTMGNTALDTLFFGGGGGSGGLDADPGGGSYGGAGGSGGGILLLSMANLNFSGYFQANGANGEDGYFTGSASPGGGGAGAGGSIFIGAESVIGTPIFSAVGGNGGTGSEAGGSPMPAGSGGDGRVHVIMPNSVISSPSAYSTCQ